MNVELLNTIVSTIFNRVKTDGEKDKIKQNHIEDDVIAILKKMQKNKVPDKMEEEEVAETLLTLNANVNNKNGSGGKSKKNKTKGGKSKKNKTRKSNTKKNKTRKN